MEFKGIKSNFYILFLSFCSCLFLSGEDFDISEYPLVIKEHRPWNLEGAEARIEAHRKGDFSVVLALPNGDAIPEGAEYRLRQVNHEFLFGGSLAADWSVPEKEWYPQFKEYFAQLFNYATVNFYWASHEKVRGQWDYDSAPLSSDIYQWARDQGMVVKGHPLMWHQVLPDWIKDSERSVRKIDKDVRRHVKNLIKSYPEIDHWDAYNEVPGIIWKEEDLGMRRWQAYKGNQIIDNEFVSGPGYVTEAIMEIARKYRPDGYYILNHYQHDDPFYHKQIQYCLDNAVDFEAIGIQTHMHSETQSFSEDSLWSALESYKQYGKPIFLSEVSVLSCGIFEDWRGLDVQEKAWQYAMDNRLPIPLLEGSSELEQYQADLTRDFYTLAFSHPLVESITWWTITDLDPWRGMPSGLLDVNGEPKPVYFVLDELINQQWNTQKEGELSDQGIFKFRGFFGSYEVYVDFEGQTYVANFEAPKGINNRLTVTLSQDG
jgi:GH35 family endo-1,4-beta-xylanase